MEKDFLENEKDILNEISDEETIYEESQCGPQEQPYLKEFHLNLQKWRLYRRMHKKGK